MRLLKDVGNFALAMRVQGIKQATQYIASNLVVKLTRQGRLDRRGRHVSFVLTVGRPNYVEAKFIKACKRAGEPLPVRKVQFKFAKK